MDNRIIKFIVYDLNKRDFMLNYALYIGISIFCNSPLKRGDKGVCKFAATHPRPLFLEGSLKVAAFGSRIYIFKSISNALFSLLHRLIVKFKIPNNFKARYIAFSDSKINYLRGSKFFYSQRMYLEW